MQIGVGPASSSTEFHVVDTGAYRYVYWSMRVCVLEVCVLEHAGMCIGACGYVYWSMRVCVLEHAGMCTGACRYVYRSMQVCVSEHTGIGCVYVCEQCSICCSGSMLCSSSSVGPE